MSFIISGSAAYAVGAAVVGGALYYSKTQANKASNAARGAVIQQQNADAAAQAKAQADAANEANSIRVAQKRAYQANALALGNGDDSLGAPGTPSPGNVLAAGASNATRAAAVAPNTALGGGAPVGGGGGPGYGGNYGGGSRYRNTRALA